MSIAKTSIRAAAGVAAGLMVYIRILLTFSALFGLGYLVLLVLTGFPAVYLAEFVFGLPGLAYYAYKLGQGYRQGRRQGEAAPK